MFTGICGSGLRNEGELRGELQGQPPLVGVWELRGACLKMRVGRWRAAGMRWYGLAVGSGFTQHPVPSES